MKPLRRSFDLAFRSADEIRHAQERRLAAHLLQCRKSPFYRKRLAGSVASSLKRFPLEALRDLPLTTKADLEARNDDFLAVPATAIRDIVQSSGTTGRPTRVMYTARDLERLAYNEAVCFKGCGMGPGDRVLLTCTLDRCFVAGYAYHLGAQAVGACTIRSGLNLAEGHAAVIALQNPTFVVGVPGFLRKLARHLHDLGRPPRGIRGLICIGEPLRDAKLRATALSQDLERLWSAPAFSTYSSSEIVTSFCECEARCGGHAAPDLGIAEIVDEAGTPLPPGQTGEVVVTPLGVEGMPLVRFRTGDVGYLAEKPCACGRNTVRLSPILGRRAHMLKIRGTTFYPATAFEVLNDIPEIGEYYLKVETVGQEDRASVHLSADPDTPGVHGRSRIASRPGCACGLIFAWRRKRSFAARSTWPIRENPFVSSICAKPRGLEPWKSLKSNGTNDPERAKPRCGFRDHLRFSQDISPRRRSCPAWS